MKAITDMNTIINKITNVINFGLYKIFEPINDETLPPPLILLPQLGQTSELFSKRLPQLGQYFFH